MGIKGLNKLLQRHAPYAFGEITLEQLRGTRVAIDGFNWIHTSYPTAKKIVIQRTDVTKHDPDESEIVKEWISLFFEFVKKWLNHSITPVFVLDGEYPMEKSDTRSKRRDDQRKTKARMLELKETVRTCDPLSITAEMIDELRKKMTNTRTIADESIDYLKELLKALGIPYIQATYEGEQLCSMLAIEGEVSAVFSTDTDNLAYGAPLLITKFSGFERSDSGGGVWKCKCVWHQNILKQLQYTHEKFVELCILGGCDYNTNMPKIGIITAYKLLNQYHSIDAFPPKYDVSPLKHHRCREMFTVVPVRALWGEGYLDYQHDKHPLLRPYLEQLGMLDRHYYVVTLFQNLTSFTPKTLFTPPPPPKLPVTKKYKNVTLIIHFT
uniref:Flap endonuclease n=1 Tax=Pithovirus LCPAC304 TaxID=2506594 RepID=A0A481Z8V2_9VIRU|nr:MAG: flap endonuclease [Pithovirus LCPAC304]